MGLSWASYQQAMLINLSNDRWAGISLGALSEAASEQVTKSGPLGAALAHLDGSIPTWRDLAEKFAKDHMLEFEVRPSQSEEQVIFWKKGDLRPF